MGIISSRRREHFEYFFSFLHLPFVKTLSIIVMSKENVCLSFASKQQVQYWKSARCYPYLKLHANVNWRRNMEREGERGSMSSSSLVEERFTVFIPNFFYFFSNSIRLSTAKIQPLFWQSGLIEEGKVQLFD